MMENVQMRLSSRASSHHHTQLYTTDFTLIMEGREQDPVHSSRPPSPPQAQCWGFAFSFWSVWSLLAHLLLVGNVLLRGTHNHGLLSTSGHCDLLSKHLRHRDQPKYGLFSNNLASETDICLERCKYALDVLPDLCLEEKVASCLWEEAEKGILLRGFQLKCQLFSRCAHLSARCLRKPGVGPSSAASNRKHHYILILCRSAKGCIVKKKKRYCQHLSHKVLKMDILFRKSTGFATWKGKWACVRWGLEGHKERANLLCVRSGNLGSSEMARGTRGDVREWERGERTAWPETEFQVLKKDKKLSAAWISNRKLKLCICKYLHLPKTRSKFFLQTQRLPGQLLLLFLVEMKVKS